MDNLQVTAYLSTPLSTDLFSPNLDALLYRLWLEEKGLYNPNVKRTEDVIKADVPIKLIEEKGYQYYSVSAPHFIILNEQNTRYRRRWDYQEHHCDFGKKKAKVDTQQGNTKSCDLPLRLIETNRIDWFCNGDKSEIDRLLSSVTNIGKKISQGFGQVFRWQSQVVEDDFSVWQDKRLMRILPAELIPEHLKERYPLRAWTYHPPYFLPENKALCAMPANTRSALN